MADDKKPTVWVPSDNGPVPYGSPESADALAPIWGMSPSKAQRIMYVQNGDITQEEADLYDQIDALDAADPTANIPIKQADQAKRLRVAVDGLTKKQP